MTPKKGQSSDLGTGDIELREDGVPQKIALFQGGAQNPQTVPVEVNLLFDRFRRSDFTAGPRWLREQTFDLSPIDDRQRVSVAVWALAENLIRLTPPTRDSRALNQAMDGLWNVWADQSVKPPLLKSIAALARTAAQGRTNVARILVVVSPGGCVPEDKEAVKAAEQSGISVFPVLLQNFNRPAQAPVNFDKIATDGLKSGDDYANWTQCLDDRGDSRGLEAITKSTGGRLLRLNYLSSGSVFQQILKWLGDQIRFDYIAGFYPAAAGEQKPHSIRIVLRDPKRGQITGGAQTIVH